MTSQRKLLRHTFFRIERCLWRCHNVVTENEAFTRNNGQNSCAEIFIHNRKAIPQRSCILGYLNAQSMLALPTSV